MNPLSSILLAATGIEADRSATFTSTVVIAGIVIVLGILVLLIFVFKAFGAIVHGAETRGKKKKLKAMESQVTVASAPSAPAVKAAPAPVVDSGIPGEVVAVIAAAVAASEGPGAVVQSVRRVRPNPVGVRNPWAAAAVAENTRPF